MFPDGNGRVNLATFKVLVEAFTNRKVNVFKFHEFDKTIQGILINCTLSLQPPGYHINGLAGIMNSGMTLRWSYNDINNCDPKFMPAYIKNVFSFIKSIENHRMDKVMDQYFDFKNLYELILSLLD